MGYRSGAESSGFNLGGKQRLSGGLLWSVVVATESGVLSFSCIINLSCFKSNCHCRVEGGWEEISFFPSGMAPVFSQILQHIKIKPLQYRRWWIARSVRITALTSISPHWILTIILPCPWDIGMTTWLVLPLKMHQFWGLFTEEYVARLTL